ncbi:hypothetical protein AB9E03_34575, partial [Rhizobium leguminosarum]
TITAGCSRRTICMKACCPCAGCRVSKLPKQAGMFPAQKPYQPTVQDLHNNGRLFPPNYLHESLLPLRRLQGE